MIRKVKSLQQRSFFNPVFCHSFCLCQTRYLTKQVSLECTIRIPFMLWCSGIILKSAYIILLVVLNYSQYKTVIIIKYFIFIDQLYGGNCWHCSTFWSFCKNYGAILLCNINYAIAAISLHY